MVNGFRGAEYNHVTGNYIIRAHDAHSWVEVYFPGQGWVTFDPTPASPDSESAPLGRFGLYLDAMSEFWREWIVNYDFLHQRTLGQSAVRQTQSAVSGTTFWLDRRYHALLKRARWAHGRALENPAPWVVGALLLLVSLAALANIRRLYAFFRRRRIAARPSRSPQAAAAIWYARMAQSLSRRGWRKLPTQTPMEFLATIGDPALRPRVERFTRHYQRARFAASAVDAELLPQLYTEIGEP
jgi:hypothetical protein